MISAPEIRRPSLADNLLDRITSFFVESHDFNGISLATLAEEFEISWDVLRPALAELVRTGRITLHFGCISENPHIKRVGDLPVADQLEIMEKERPGYTCAYPSKRVILGTGLASQYNDRPFSRYLFLGTPQLATVFFEIAAVDRYRDDPRYRCDLQDFDGSIGISDSAYLDPKTPDRDKVGIQTFGLGYSDQGHRVVGVPLRYLADLSPGHQQSWNSFRVQGRCRLVEEYIRASLYGEFIMHLPILRAVTAEQKGINDLLVALGKPPLFRETFTEHAPIEYTIFFNPTRKRFMEFIGAFEKMLVQNLNTDFFRAEGFTWTDAHPKTIRWLGEWVGRELKETDPEWLVGSLAEVRKIRQEPAHALKENDLDPAYHTRQNEIVSRVYGALAGLRERLAARIPGSEKIVPDYLRAGKIGIY